MTPMESINQQKSLEQGLKVTFTFTFTLPLPLPVSRAIVKLGEDLRLARLRRRLTQQSLAERVGASVNTIKRMEAGDPRIPLHFIARTLHVFGEASRLAQLLDTGQDSIGLTLANEQLPQRVRARRSKPPGTASGEAL